jgi:hypothetical protein
VYGLRERATGAEERLMFIARGDLQTQHECGCGCGYKLSILTGVDRDGKRTLVLHERRPGQVENWRLAGVASSNV